MFAQVTHEKNYLVSLLLILLAYSSTAFAQHAALTAADYARAEKMLGYNTGPLVDRTVMRPTFLPDGRLWYQTVTPTGTEFVLINPADGSRKVGTSLEKLGVAPSAATPDAPEHSVVSPDGKRAAYIKDFNLWVKDLATGKETQLTTDGVKDFGYATDNAGWKHSDACDPCLVAGFEKDRDLPAGRAKRKRQLSGLDQRRCPEARAPGRSALPGDPNVPMIHRVIIDVDAAKVTRLQMAPDPHRSTTCDDISCDGGWDDVYWSRGRHEARFRLDVARSQESKSSRRRCRHRCGPRRLSKRQSPTQFESSPGQRLELALSAREQRIHLVHARSDGWGHLYLYDLTTGKLKNQITTGEFAVWRVE